MAAYRIISALLYFLIRKNCDDCRLLYSSIFHDKNCAAYGSASTGDYNNRPSEKSNCRNRPTKNQPPIRDLGQLMIIKRPRYRNRRILIRHFILTTLTWLMWLAIIYFISRNHCQIFSRPFSTGKPCPNRPNCPACHPAAIRPPTVMVDHHRQRDAQTYAPPTQKQQTKH
jgi:hypothetical protein